ncbi:rolling circle replication-associated protein [Castellaniella sp. UC4442_H9]
MDPAELVNKITTSVTTGGERTTSFPGPGAKGSVEPLAGSSDSLAPAPAEKGGHHARLRPKPRSRPAARRRLKAALREQRRIARELGLEAVCVTLTYRAGETYTSKDLSKFRAALFAHVRRSHPTLKIPLPYLWVLDRGGVGEVKDDVVTTGVLHYHLLLWVPRGFPLRERLAKWWAHGSTWHERCRRPNDWTTYMTKATRATFPKGSRLYGCGGLDDVGKLAVARAGWPRWLLRHIPRGEHANRIVGAGWVHIETGVLYESPYVWRKGRCILKSSLPSWEAPFRLGVISS